jgi:hypothetical protein
MGKSRNTDKFGKWRPKNQKQRSHRPRPNDDVDFRKNSFDFTRRDS